MNTQVDEELNGLSAEAGSTDTLNQEDSQNNEVDYDDDRENVQEADSNREADEGQRAEDGGDDQEAAQQGEYEDILESVGDKKRGVQEVPVSFLKRTRENEKRLKELETAEKKRLEAENTQYRTLLNETLAPKEKPINPYESLGEMPDATYDPQGAIEWTQKRNEIDRKELLEKQQQIAQQTQYMQAVQNLNMRESAYESQNSGYMNRKKQYIDDAVNRATLLYGEQEAGNIRNKLEYDLMVRVSNMITQGIQDPIATLDNQLQQILPAQSNDAKKPQRDISATNRNAKAQKTVGKAGTKSSANNNELPTYEQMMSGSIKSTDITKYKKKYGNKAWNEHLNKLYEEEQSRQNGSNLM